MMWGLFKLAGRTNKLIFDKALYCYDMTISSLHFFTDKILKFLFSFNFGEQGIHSRSERITSEYM